jgi:hypothetical protein
MTCPRGRLVTLVLLLAASLLGTVAVAQRRDAFVRSRDHEAIRYSTAPVSDAVTALNRRLREGHETLRFDSDGSGYLRSLLRALRLPIESQALVFSPTSLQSDRIRIHNPRAVYFNDTVALGFVRGGDILEVAALDPRQGVVFYSLDQQSTPTPQLRREDHCLACHLSWDTLGVPGLLLTSMMPLPDDPNAYANGFTTVQGSPLEQRWGGWWVTGSHGGARHMGNVPVMPADARHKLPAPTRELTSVEGLFDLKAYPTPYSDVVAQLVLGHQVRMTNLMTRAAWEARVAAAEPDADAAARVTDAVNELVDYMLFVDEAALPGPIRGTSGFAEVFAAGGPRDSRGRSLRDLDLRRRLFRYPCSYMIYTEAFDALPPAAKNAVYARLGDVLAGRDPHPRYRALSAADRTAVVQILRETKKDLPASFPRR